MWSVLHARHRAPARGADPRVRRGRRVTALVAGSLALAGLGASPAQAAPFANGSFEDPVIGSMFVAFPAGSNIGAWSVQNVNVEILQFPSFPVSDGVQSIDMIGNQGPGARLEQTFDTIGGAPYELTYDVAGRCAGDVTATIDGTLGDSVTVAAGDPFVTRTVPFTAAGTSTTLSMSTTIQGAANCGAVLDNVTITLLNQAPVCTDASASGTTEQPTTIPLPCTDPDGDALTPIVVTQPPPAEGVVTVSGDEFVFTPTEDFAGGTVTFTFRTEDPSGASSTTQTITITVALTCGGLTPTITGTQGNDRLRGTRGVDVIAGLGGNDTIDGQDGNDFICGGSGVDSLRGDAGNDQIFGGSGSDDLRGDAGNDILNAGAGNDRLRGDDGNDTLRGEVGNDDLEGDSGVDQLLGGDDDDEFDGGSGSPDVCNGEAGNDFGTRGCEVVISIP